MNKLLLRFIFMFVSMFLSYVAFAQEKVEMADNMRSNGKIYVVVAVCLTILVGLFIYVFLLDKKISRYENSSVIKDSMEE